MRRHSADLRIAAVLVATLLVAACDTGASGGPGDTGPATLAPGATPTDIPIGPNDSSGPQDTGDLGIPGFDGWRVVNGQDVAIGATDAGLAMTLTHKAQWSDAGNAVLFWTKVKGDFRVTSTVETSKTSDSSQDPGGNGTIQLAGLMARAGTSQENYVFVAVGSDANGLSVETASTTNNVTRSEGPAWPSGDGELKLCRIGTTFTLWRRAVGSSDDFVLAATFKRSDLSGELQVGASIESDGTPDITALFGDLTIDSLDPGEAC